MSHLSHSGLNIMVGWLISIRQSCGCFMTSLTLLDQKKMLHSNTVNKLTFLVCFLLFVMNINSIFLVHSRIY